MLTSCVRVKETTKCKSTSKLRKEIPVTSCAQALSGSETRIEWYTVFPSHSACLSWADWSGNVTSYSDDFCPGRFLQQFYKRAFLISWLYYSYAWKCLRSMIPEVKKNRWCGKGTISPSALLTRRHADAMNLQREDFKALEAFILHY